MRCTSAPSAVDVPVALGIVLQQLEAVESVATARTRTDVGLPNAITAKCESVVSCNIHTPTSEDERCVACEMAAMART
jgi:hypothetical protein